MQEKPFYVHIELHKKIVKNAWINDIKKLIDNVVQRPFFCSDTEITTDNGYVITTKEHYEKLKNIGWI